MVVPCSAWLHSVLDHAHHTEGDGESHTDSCWETYTDADPSTYIPGDVLDAFPWVESDWRDYKREQAEELEDA